MSTTFPSFVLLKQNRRYAVIAVIAAVVQFVVFKLYYPYPDFSADSHSYIFAAAAHVDVNLWPIGYSKFLSLIHQFTDSATAIIALQYFLGLIISLYFFFTLRYLFTPDRLYNRMLFIGLFFNPLVLYLSNYVSSDSIFLTGSIWWLTQLLWMLHGPSILRIFTHAVLIALLFTFRYNAMVYPIISAIALLISGYKAPWKLTGIALPLILIFLFVQHTKREAYRLTGKAQFSIFSGWQIANNALYMYPHIQVTQAPPAACTALDLLVKKYFIKVPEEMKDISPRQGAFYIKYAEGPLKQYLVQHTDVDNDSTGSIQTWGAVSPVFNQYGWFLVQHHPWAFARYFLLPNAVNYCLPPLEKLKLYNGGREEIFPIIAYWFHYPSLSVKVASIKFQGMLFSLCPAVFLLLNLLFIWLLINWVQISRKRKADPLFKHALLIVTLFMVINAGFSIVASPIVFRYQIFPMIICFCFQVLIIQKLSEAATVNSERN